MFRTDDTDFEDVDQAIYFDMPGSQCVNISIVEDGILENNEEFLVILTSDDPAVKIHEQFAPVTIVDSESMLIMLSHSKTQFNKARLNVASLVQNFEAILLRALYTHLSVATHSFIVDVMSLPCVVQW